MRFLPLIILVLMASCGGSGTDITPTATPSPTPSNSPSPSPSQAPVVFVGNWISANGNTLDFTQDGTAKSGSQTLQWSLDSNNQILFSVNSIGIDSCGYEILTFGGLISNLTVTLDLACNKAGLLTYTKSN